MQAATIALLATASIIALALGQVFLAALLFFTLCAIITYYFLLVKTARGAKKVAKSLTKGTMADLEKAKGQSPKGGAELQKIAEAIGGKMGEAAWAKPEQTYKSTDLAGRIGQGSKNLLESFGRLFK